MYIDNLFKYVSTLVFFFFLHLGYTFHVSRKCVVGRIDQNKMFIENKSLNQFVPPYRGHYFMSTISFFKCNNNNDKTDGYRSLLIAGKGTYLLLSYPSFLMVIVRDMPILLRGRDLLFCRPLNPLSSAKVRIA